MTDPGDVPVLGIGIEAEKESLRTYLGLAWATHDASGKQMFIRLATDEFEHMCLLETWQTDRQPPAAVGQSPIERLIPRLSDKSLQIRGTGGQHQISALNAALDLEKSARTFYEEQGRTAQEGPARALFRRLAEMEAAHYALIQAEIDNIQQTGFWLGLREFTLEKER